MRNLFLTGFMGAGKSTIGKILARKISWAFVDTDKLIEERGGRTLSEIFSESEGKFRELELNIIAEVAEGEKQVIALGGGALVSQINRDKVLETGHLIYLKAQPQTLAKRLKGARVLRPLLQKENDQEAFIEKLLKERESDYIMAHTTINTDKKSPESTAQDIIIQLGLLKK